MGAEHKSLGWWEPAWVASTCRTKQQPSEAPTPSCTQSVERKSAVNGEKVCQLKFVNLSMELELKEEAEIKEDMEEDMFADDVDLGDTFYFSTGEVIEMKKEDKDSKM